MNFRHVVIIPLVINITRGIEGRALALLIPYLFDVIDIKLGFKRIKQLYYW